MGLVLLMWAAKLSVCSLPPKRGRLGKTAHRKNKPFSPSKNIPPHDSASFKGFYTTGVAKGVGRTTAQAVVYALVTILVSDFCISYLQMR